jgi:hypothetical protein
MGKVLAASLLIWGSLAHAADFADVLPGAKAMGMGTAFSAVADDPSAMFYNPAGTANTPYAQAGTSMGRMLSPVGTLSFASLTYLRPYEPMATASVGAAYYAGRQTDGGDKDVFLFHYSQELRVNRLPLTKPLKLGANFKFVNIDREGPGSFGIGFDAGVIARSNFGLSGSLALMDLTTNVGVPSPLMVLGTAYVWKKWLTVAGDLRARNGGNTEFYPGVEAGFLQGLLKVRAGRGLQLDGVGQVSFGLGVNFSPVILDVAMTLPTSGIHRRGGAYQATFNYRFGAPSFTGNFMGQAAGAVEALRADILRLEERKKTLSVETQVLETNKAVVAGERQVLEKRVGELQDEYRMLQKSKDEAEYELSGLRLEKKNREPVVKPAPAPPKPAVRRETWPKSHVAKADDTLRSLALKYYNDANLWEQIYEANRDKVDRGLPREGAALVIPEPKRTWLP